MIAERGCYFTLIRVFYKTAKTETSCFNLTPVGPLREEPSGPLSDRIHEAHFQTTNLLQTQPVWRLAFIQLITHELKR